MKKYHPIALLIPVARTSGSWQDLVVDGTEAVYWNRRKYVHFIDQCLEASKENILQDNLFYILTHESMQSSPQKLECRTNSPAIYCPC